MQSTELLIIGAGPYGLSLAAHAKASGRDVAMVGEPMAFWKQHMPRGMFLRSGFDWHLDAAGVHTLEAFLEEKHISRDTVDPIPVELFCDYADWFRASKKIEPQRLRVAQLRRTDGRFEVICEGGEIIHATNVVATPGLAPFIHLPEDVTNLAESGRAAHTCSLVDSRRLAGQRCFIYGGRQSAFEWGALMVEAGADVIHIAYRHDTPRFETSDWSFTDAMIENSLRVRGWFRRLPQAEQEALHKRLWTEGRLKLEPWLWPRVNKKSVKLWPRSRIVGCRASGDGPLTIQFDSGAEVDADQLLFATGYRVDLSKVSYLQDEFAAGRLKVSEGYPALDEDFQTSLSGLYITGQAAVRDFGPVFGFVRGCVASARIIVASLTRA